MDNNEEVVECPLCMEPLEVDDLNFFPCTCGYQICRFCWHRIRTDENKLCPACRKEYTENPADFTPLTQEEILAFKSQKKQRDQKRKQKIRVTENRKHLSNVRVVQKNLVFVVGLPPRLADAEVLKKHEYFGKYGKIHKVVINPSTTYAGVQGPSASAYVTYVHNNDALRAIQSVNTRNIIIDGRLIKTSLGTTKYCSHFMKNQLCPKGDCMYLHELGDPEASFTKEEMHQGKHQEYEKRLHDALAVGASSSGTNGANDASQSNGSTGVPVWGSNGSESNNGNTSNSKGITINKTTSTSSLPQPVVSSAVSSPSLTSTSNVATTEVASEQVTDTCPSLSVSPVNKDISAASLGELKHKKERGRHEKVKNEKNVKSKNKSISNDICKNYTTNAQRENTSNHTDVKDDSEASADGTTHLFASPIQDRNVTPNNSSSSIVKTKINKPKAAKKSLDEIDTIKSNEDFEKKSDENSDRSNGMDNTNAPCELFESLEIISDDVSNINDNKPGDVVVQVLDKPYDESIPRTEEADILGDNTIGLAQLHLFDNKIAPIFSKTPLFQEAMLPDDNVEDLSTQMNNVKISPLPDLLKGIEEQQLQHVQPHQQKELSRLFELHKQGNIFGNATSSQSNVAQNGLQSHFGGITDIGQSPLTALEHASELLMHQNLYGINMSKFFDFHKNQQLQLQQHCVSTEQTGGSGNSSILDSNPNTYPFLQHSAGLSTLQQQQQHQQKHRSLGQLDSMLTLQPHHSTIQAQQHPLHQNQHNRVQNEFTANSFVDDDLGFDPFTETQKGLAELMENEIVKPTHSKSSSCNSIRMGIESNMMQQHQHSVDNMQRARMPPPGFNHMSAFGLSAPREQNASKMMPYINMTGNRGLSNEIQHLTAFNSWDSHLQSPRHQLQSFNDLQAHQMNHNSRNTGSLGNDWTAMDPAILSFRQFPSCPQPNQMLHHIQQKDLFPQHLPHQQQNSFGNPAHGATNIHLTSNQMGSQSAAQAQVNANVQGMLEYLKNRQFF